MEREQMEKLTVHTAVKAEKIRILFDAGVARGDIAKFLEISYQHVQNVLKRSGKLASSPRAAALTVDSASDWQAVVVGRGGQITLPDDYLREEGLSEGDLLICRRERDGIHIMTRTAAAKVLRELARERMPEGAALLDALIDTGRKPSD